ncbi:hypothetical protein B9Z55_000849 [Caenorhabditis nigoni]|uniref:Uncharacterized protein n=1 Tax=Caenorhabditis nigoni TaxID=1611254 RepID=A0A2G5VV43_9PELO|nr:hypothetical protein B9Z55_000849 [Caenorhabditis nigoni]
MAKSKTKVTDPSKKRKPGRPPKRASFDEFLQKLKYDKIFRSFSDLLAMFGQAKSPNRKKRLLPSMLQKQQQPEIHRRRLKKKRRHEWNIVKATC